MTAWQRRLAARVLVSCLLAALVAVIVQLEWLWRLDLVVYDLLLRLPTRAASRDIVLVAIDEQSLAQLGRWPWARTRHAELVSRLTADGVRAIALDIAFTEPSEDDAALATALRASGRVVLPVVHEQATLNAVPIEGLPVPDVAAAAAGLGHVDVEVDPDGMARSVYLQAGLGRAAWPHLALALLRQDRMFGTRVFEGERDPDTSPAAPYEWVRDHRILVPFSGSPGHFRRVSYVDVLSGHVPAEWVRGAFVFVGPTATGLGDQVPTPVSGVGPPMSGIEFNANVLEALRRGVLPRFATLQITMLASAGIVFVVSLALSFGRRQVLLVVGAIAAVLAGTWALFAAAALWFTPMPAIAGLLLAYPIASSRWHAQAVARERERTHQALGSLAEGVITADAEGRIDYLNPAAQSLVGDSVGMDLGVILRSDEGTDLALAGDGAPLAAALRRRDGTWTAVRASIVVLGERGQPRLGTVVAVTSREPEVTPRRLAPVRDDRAADVGRPHEVHDAVMPAPVRTQIETRLSHLVAEAAQLGRHVAVLVLDITQLRHVNVAFGRRGGDALLQAVADRLRGALREREAVSHVGGDEFVILLRNLVRPSDAVTLATRLTTVFDPPFLIDDVEVRVRANIGLAISPDHGTESLLQRAETARSWARDHEQAPVQLYGTHMTAPALDRLVLERALQAALETDQLSLVFQPQASVESGRIVGAEVLVRWQHPQFGAIPATTLIALAEETRLIETLGEWVLRATCTLLADWHARGVPTVCLAVNVSPRQFLQPGLAEEIGRILASAGVATSEIELEITETALVGDLERARTTLEQIRAMGMRIALDDFGVGYSSLGHLSRFPVDCVKIDRSFVDNVTVDGHDRTICLAVLAMAKSMHRRVVAEGVETIEQARFFAAKGCDVVQGYYISRPVAADELERLVTTGATFTIA